ncbi:MAG: 3-hydroxybutyrate dehydrogenase [Proteobacteria bacterium]|nr:3-hydroxybutyrate dehydrogenase [Burkholderiales bacterium]
MKLEGKVALVTGAASGIGRAIVETFAQAGCAVAIADLNLAGAEAVAEAITADGGRALGVSMDVTDEAQVEAGFDACMNAFGHIDVLVSNAGIQIVKAVQDFEFAEWRKMIAIHLDGAFLCTRAALKRMYAADRGGVLLYMGSVHSKEASALKAPYVAAKHALVGLAKTVAKEGGPKGVRTNVICPGFVKTPLVLKQIPDLAREHGMTEEEVAKKIMLKETVDAEFTTLDDVAQTALFLASFPTNALTGQSVIVSHGWHME